MSKRVTIMIDESNMTKVRKHQTVMIQKTNGAYSFSRSINDLLRGKI